MTDETPLRIDVGAVLRQRAPGVARLMPRFVVRSLERFIRQDEMNAMLDATAGLRDAAFCRGVLDHLGVSCDVSRADRLPRGDDARVVFVSNHPLGGLDGMALIAMLTEMTGRTVYCVVNDLLLAIGPLRGIFLPVNKHGRQNRDDGSRLEEVFAGPDPILMFPAGLCSRRGKDGVVADTPWRKMFVNRCIRHGRDVIPLHFSGQNSNFFYNFAALRARSGLRFNIEMARLPAEVFLSRGKRFTVTVGERIPCSALQGGQKAVRQAAEIRDTVYKLALPSEQERS